MADISDGVGADYRSIAFAPVCGKGGVAKSTLASQIADNAARFGLRVAAIDLDANGALSTMTGTIADAAKGELSVRDILEGKATPKEVVRIPENWQPTNGLRWDRGGELLPGGAVHVIPAPHEGLERATNMNGAEAEMRLAMALNDNMFGEDYDIIVIDAPGTEGPAFYLALNAAEHLLFPLQAEILGFRGFMRTIEAAIRFRRFSNKSVDAIGAVATMVKNNNENRETIADAKDWLQTTFGGRIPMLEPTLPQRAVVSEAVPLQVPVSRMVTRSGRFADISAGYSRIALAVVASIIPEERFDAIIAALEQEELDDAAADVLFKESDELAPAAAPQS